MSRKVSLIGLLAVMSFILILILGISNASALSIDSVRSSPSEISPGDIVNVEVNVENNLGDEVRDVVISLKLENTPFSPYQNSNEYTYERIRDDNSETARFALITSASAESGNYNIPVLMSYTLDNEEYSRQGLISLSISAKPSLSIVLESSGSVLIKGKNNRVNLRIVNSGLGDARLLNVILSGIDGATIIGGNSVYIGDIPSDDFDNAEFNIFLNQNAPSVALAKITLKYLDSGNKEISQELNVPLRTYTEKEAISLGLEQRSNAPFYLIIAVVIIAAYIFYRRRKKKKLAAMRK
jgi:hypothetical protein